VEAQQIGLLELMLIEREATADPTLPVPECAHDLLVVYDKSAARRTSRLSTFLLLLLLPLLWVQISVGWPHWRMGASAS